MAMIEYFSHEANKSAGWEGMEYKPKQYTIKYKIHKGLESKRKAERTISLGFLNSKKSRNLSKLRQ